LILKFFWFLSFAGQFSQSSWKNLEKNIFEGEV
jgi:hypothetical protein